MLFTTFYFLVFFISVCFLYFFLPHRWRWLVLLLASYYFYACVQVYYVGLLIFVSLVGYFTTILMDREQETSRKKIYLLLSIFLNIGILFFFKYFNFFSASISGPIAGFFNIAIPVINLNLILPIGLSFYVFQALSYSIDVYWGKKTPERHFGIFSLYISFFPQLLAGPIERSTHLLPQFFQKHNFDHLRVKKGLLLILWGFFKKLVIADRLALIINQVYHNPESYSGISLLMASFFYAFQLYCDFSGYSDIAIGTARVLGFDLIKNFNLPYFASSLSKFWQRWHISLSSWLMDYVYTPLVISKRNWGKFAVIYGIFVALILCGLWHGANWTFVVFGFLHALALTVEFLTKNIRKKLSRFIPYSFYKSGGIIFTFCFFCFTLIFFRSDSIYQAGYIIKHILSHCNPNLFIAEVLNIWGIQKIGLSMFLILFLIIVELLQYIKCISVDWLSEQSILLRWSVYYFLILSIIFFQVHDSTKFIYFNY